MGILFDDGPGPAVGTLYRLLTLSPGDKAQIIILGNGRGLQTHWCKAKRCLPCLGDCCPYHDEPQDWKGYLPVMAWNPKEEAISTSFGPRILEVGASHRQWRLDVQRAEKFDVVRPQGRSRILRMTTLPAVELDGLPVAFDVVPSLLRLWRLTGRSEHIFSGRVHSDGQRPRERVEGGPGAIADAVASILPWKRKEKRA